MWLFRRIKMQSFVATPVPEASPRELVVMNLSSTEGVGSPEEIRQDYMDLEDCKRALDERHDRLVSAELNLLG